MQSRRCICQNRSASLYGILRDSSLYFIALEGLATRVCERSISYPFRVGKTIYARRQAVRTQPYPSHPLLFLLRVTCFASTNAKCYVVTASPARNPESKYQAWGHSSIVDPWGSVVATTEHEDALVVAEVDIGRVEEVRKGIPVSLQKRPDLYRLELP